jgi:actin-like ATPase involved in cell morphogenesis
MIKITVVFEMEEEQIKELFEGNEIKFSKKKMKELQEDLEYTSESVQEALEETFQEVVEERIQELFE